VSSQPCCARRWIVGSTGRRAPGKGLCCRHDDRYGVAGSIEVSLSAKRPMGEVYRFAEQCLGVARFSAR
jgi:hypothetical protein